MENFTPLEGLVGGLMIGGAAAVLAVLNGRIAGIAGIYRGLIAFGAGWGERATFVAGLLLGPIIVGGFGGIVPIVEISTNWFVLIFAGLLVGFGASLGNGCTSGHGVCGLARGSLRSLVATLTFMGVAVAVVLISRLLCGW
jgi:uncharacterized membrane protein YedE/YeeE